MKARVYNLSLAAAWLIALWAMPLPSTAQERGRAPRPADATGQTASPQNSTAAGSRADDAAQANERSAPSPAQIAAWIKKLDDRRYRVRERATERLLAAGLAALDPLLEAANGQLPEPADRARWMLQRLAQDDDPVAALAALDRLVQLRDRPNLVAQAWDEHSRLSVLVCRRELESLGAECEVLMDRIVPLNVMGPVFHVRLGGNWRGTKEDLRPLVQLSEPPFVRLEGRAVDDAVVKMFEERDVMIWLQLINTKVTVAAVDSLKERHPNTDVYLKNQALMGVRCRNHAAGAYVEGVESGTAADAGGIAVGDVITALDGNALPDFDRLTAHVAQHAPGDRVQVEVLRGEEKVKLYVTLGSWQQFEAR